MAFFFILVIVAAGIAFILWQLHEKKVNAAAPPVSSPSVGAQAVATSPPPVVVDWRNSPITQALAGGSGGNGVPGPAYDAKSVYRKDTFLDGPGTFWFPAGVTTYTVKALGGEVVNVIVGPAEEGHGAGSVSVPNQTQAIVNGYATLYFQAQGDNPTLTVNCDKPGLLQRS